MTITLNPDQQQAYDALVAFLANDVEPVFVLAGYAGTGKSTMIRKFIEDLPNLNKTVKLINPRIPDYELVLTATTNKAAENLAEITGALVGTIQSHLGLIVMTDYATGATSLKEKSGSPPVEDQLIFIDEASYIDKKLMTVLFRKAKNCKIVFMGDPAQLTPVKSIGTPVFDAPFPGAKLTQVVRQKDGNPIGELAAKFRETVNTGQYFKFMPDGIYVKHLDEDAFGHAVLSEFGRPSWHYSDSKLLTWTNKASVAYNKAVSDHCSGNANLQAGDYAVCNKYFAKGSVRVKTDELVRIASISGPATRHDVHGRYYTLEKQVTAFCPDRLQDTKAREKLARAKGEYEVLREIDTEWLDLRSVYACTINKSQGSTYDKVFIDLNDLKKCNSGDQLARMLYVGVSRAREQVVFTGDLV